MFYHKQYSCGNSQKVLERERKMEDGVPEAESLLHPVNPSAKGEAKQEDDNKDVESRGEERESGLINHLISSLVSAGQADEEKEQELQKPATVRAAKDEEKVGGLLSNLLSNLVSPASPKARENEEKVAGFEAGDGVRTGTGGSRSEEDVGVSEVGGGPILNIISNFFNHREGAATGDEQPKEDQRTAKTAENHEPVKTEDEGEGSIIDNIVSHLPASFPDDAAPTTDEASILIHSIVHD